MDPRWRPGWPHDHHAWPDLGVPDDASAALAALAALLARARDGEQVEIGCLGGHGRTGTALAALAVLTGEDPRSAVAWVRARYCPMAVETAEQEEWVASLPPATG
ncbi:protein phosphatase [Auraticoccus sp. F435]|uniref:Protein phosphatase n=1 Tax=Auraticoccus cholistanensis TaxID=2656650 RepID=A0A6A9UYT7_9ACTN|nr:protein-tyrosine phosphatase family protein [Auraticoccus cholistanensis]MVA77072.1 protein phosphatase [Auraticoccus cholistanensis]